MTRRLASPEARFSLEMAAARAPVSQVAFALLGRAGAPPARPLTDSGPDSGRGLVLPSGDRMNGRQLFAPSILALNAGALMRCLPSPWPP
jgi:hypothetical protein